MTPAFNITLGRRVARRPNKRPVGGQPVPLNDRLVSLEITDKGGIESDQLTLSLADPDSALILPHRGVELTAAIGYTETGLIEKGVYVVDEVDYSSPPNRLEIVARAADFRNSFREKREESYHDTTLGDILAKIAGRAGLLPVVSETLASVAIAHIDQVVSDSAFFAKLAEIHGAVHAIKSGRMIFIGAGEGKDAGGVGLPGATITESECTSWRLSITDRTSNVTGVKARYLDREKAQTYTVTVGDGENTITLSASFPTKAAAAAAASADLRRRRQKGRTIDLTLAGGRPEMIAETPITLAGFKADIDGAGWIASEVTHSLGNDGYTLRLVLESKVS